MQRCVILFCLFTCSVFALEKKPLPHSAPKTPSHLMLGSGAFDVDKSHPTALFQLEYRWDVHFRHVRPLAGFFVAAQGNCYLFAGCGIDAFLGKKIVLTPSFAPGIYYHGGGKHLGFPVNFRSAIDLSYVCANKARWGLQFNHISNAGMLWKNPGANSLVIFYALCIY